MMTVRGVGPIIAGLGLVAGGLAVASPVRAASAALRYASPTGSSTDACTKSDPCDLDSAIEDTDAGATVLIAPGSYGSANAPLMNSLHSANQGNSITVLGEDPSDPPVIYTAAAGGGLLLNSSSVAWVTIISTSPSDGLQLVNSTADHVSVFGANAQYGACAMDSATMIDSLCAEAGSDTYAVGTKASSAQAEQDNVLRGVTAVAFGSNCPGLQILATDTTVKFAVTNSIIVGGGDGAFVQGTGNPATVTLRHSDVGRSQVVGTGSIAVNASDTTAAPVFVNPAINDFREKKSSPTVNAGAKDATSDRDLDGFPRTLGKAPDMGAFELPEKPSISKPGQLQIGKHSVSLRVAVNGEGLPTTARLDAVAGGHRIDTSPMTIGTGRSKPITLRLAHLHRHRTYRVAVIAANQAGSRRSTSRKITVK